MKHIINSIAIAIAIFTISSCGKNEAANYIKETYGYANTKITEFGKVEQFASPYRFLMAAELKCVFLSSYAWESINNSFDAPNKKKAIKILTECRDSVKTVFDGLISGEQDGRIYAVVSNPRMFLGIPDDNFAFNNEYSARLISFTTPDGYVKKDVLIYDDQGRISCLGEELQKEYKEFGDVYLKLQNDIWEVESEIRNWKRGRYN